MTINVWAKKRFERLRVAMELKRNERKRKRFVEKSTGIVLNGGDRLGNSTAMIAKGTA